MTTSLSPVADFNGIAPRNDNSPHPRLPARAGPFHPGPGFKRVALAGLMTVVSGLVPLLFGVAVGAWYNSAHRHRLDLLQDHWIMAAIAGVLTWSRKDRVPKASEPPPKRAVLNR
jgi:hypothetical protein